MKFLRNLSIRSKLLALIVMPLVLALVFILNIPLEDFHIFSVMQQAQKIEELNIVASKLIHELQRENGFSLGFLSAKGKKFSSDLTEQIARTDKKLMNYQQVSARFNSARNNQQFSELILSIDHQFEMLGSFQQGVNQQNMPSKKIIEYYIKLNSSLLEINRLISTLINNQKISQQMTAHLYLLQDKELASIERTVLTQAFIAKKTTVQIYKNLFIY